MKTHKKLSIIFIAVMILSLVLVGGAAAKSDNKVEVCQQEGNGTFELVKIKANTLQAHLAHGDAFPGAAVPGQPGMTFAADCSLTSTGQNQQSQTLTVLPATNNGKKAAKVDVCHRRGNGTFILININGNALPAHKNHGDGLPNGLLPGQTDKRFSADCSVLEQKELVQTLFVDSKTNTPAAPVVSMALQDGQLYELKVSGTYTYKTVNGIGQWADAECYIINNVVVKGDVEGSVPWVLDLSINDPTTNTDWGSCQVTHEYTKQWMGNGTALSFSIYDSNSGDNVGILTVEIWKINW